MKKEFNITGNCYADRHYMMNNSAKINMVFDLVERGKYFAINRPRQYGKTTTLFAVSERLQKSEEYTPIRLNFQGIDQKWHESDSAFAQMFVKEMIRFLEFTDQTLFEFAEKMENSVIDINTLSYFITQIVHQSTKKLVLLIDEVDASSNYMPFLSFLGMLRTKYLDRTSPHHYTFHSVVLVGVHDVKSLKFKIRNPEEASYNSPWNIAIDFESAMEFEPKEIEPMLIEYSHAENVQIDTQIFSEKLYLSTSGYPFLVSRLCQIIAEKILPKKSNQENKVWELDDLEKATQMILNEVNTNFESLIKNLENNQDLYDLVFAMLINGQNFAFNADNATIRKGVIYGVFKQNGKLKIHNRIYEQRIYNYLISNIETQKSDFSDTESQFILPNGGLNFQQVLLRFQAYIKESFSQKEKDFWEKQWRLIFLAFLRPILNGKGHDFREVQISDERRLDVVITYGKFQYIIELKIWRGDQYHTKGLEQLKSYLDSQNTETGFLVIFDQRREMTERHEWIEQEGKKIFAIWI